MERCSYRHIRPVVLGILGFLGSRDPRILGHPVASHTIEMRIVHGTVHDPTRLHAQPTVHKELARHSRDSPAEALPGRRPPPGGRKASMRPREFPAEAAGRRASRRHLPLRGFNEAAGVPRGSPAEDGREVVRILRASMRPREFPAEAIQSRPRCNCRRNASMRPREFPAEAARIDAGQGVKRPASMRPREFPAEASRARRRMPKGGRRASMRPREFPAEAPLRMMRSPSTWTLQ